MTIWWFRVTQQERTATTIGVFAWVTWFIGVSVLMSSAVHDQASNDILSSPFFRWVALGPLFTFIFLGRLVMRFERKLTMDTRGNWINVVISVISFMAWGSLLLVWDISFGANSLVALPLGLVFTYLALVASNRRWNP